jgi:hypothetical protein
MRVAGGHGARLLTRLYEDIDRCATLDCQGAVRGCVWGV